MPTSRFSPPPLTDGDPWVAEPDVDELVAIEVKLQRLATVFDDPEEDVGRAFDQADALCSVVPLTETLLAEPPTPALVALLLLVCRQTITAELIALQRAFGSRAAESDIAELVRVADRARRRGLTTEAYVEQRQLKGWEPDTPSARLLAGESRRRPDDTRVRRGVRVLRDAVVYADEVERATLFCALGRMHWACGRRAIAQTCLTAAILCDPQHPVAPYLATMIVATLPDWIGRPAAMPAEPGKTETRR